MLPGVGIPEDGLPEFKAGDVLAIRVGDSPCLAVGIAVVSQQEYKDSNYEMKGKAIEVLHTFEDHLWSVCFLA